MTDADLAAYLGIDQHHECAAILARMPTTRRAAYERMANLELEILLAIDGLGPVPTVKINREGVLIDWDDEKKQNRHWQ